MPKKMNEATQRVHILLFSSDWDELGRLYGDTVRRGQVIRALVRNYVRGIGAKAASHAGTAHVALGGEVEE